MGRNNKLDRAVRLGLPQLRRQGLHERAQIDHLPPQVAVAHPRKLEQVINEPFHVAAGRANALEVVLPERIELAGVAFEHHLAETADAAERSPQVVRDSVGKGLELPVERLQLRGAHAHALFQFFIQAADSLLRHLEGSNVNGHPRDPHRLAFGVTISPPPPQHPAHGAVARQEAKLRLVVGFGFNSFGKHLPDVGSVVRVNQLKDRLFGPGELLRLKPI